MKLDEFAEALGAKLEPWRREALRRAKKIEAGVGEMRRMAAQREFQQRALERWHKAMGLPTD